MLIKRFALGFIVMLLFFLIPAYGFEVSVSMIQPGTLREPFDVSQNIVYNVRLDNVDRDMRYTVEMTAGPNSLESVVSKSFSANINAKPGSSDISNVAKFDVNFQSPGLRRGAFETWFLDQNRTEIWDKAWYRVKVTSFNPFEKPVEVEGPMGSPALAKVVEVFKDPKVTPGKGTNQDRFEYQVAVNCTVTDNITLEVGPTRNGPWTPVSTQDYTTPGGWQVLKWPNVTLDFDYTSAAYKVSGRKEKIFDGPSWPIDVEFRNNTLSPDWGPFDSSFNYSIDIESPKPIDVELYVWDVGNKRYSSAGRLKYTDINQWQKLVWNDIKTTSVTDAAGDSKYYYSFYYEGSESSISSTYEKTGRYFSGPTISVIGLKNSTVTPGNGTTLIPYTYSVQVLTKLPKCSIKLQTAPPGSDIWLDKGTITYNGYNNTLVWKNIGVEHDSKAMGNASYRFIWGDTVLGEFSGPDIEVEIIEDFKEPMVTPNKGTNDDQFEYQVAVNCTVADNITLEVGPTRNGPWTSVGTQRYTTPGSWQVLKWPNVTLDFDFNAASYRFTGRKPQVFDGPFYPIELEFKNAGVTPPRGTQEQKFQYSLEINASHPIDVGLNFLDITTGKFVSYDTMKYTNATSWEKLIWDDVKVASGEDSVGASSYFFSLHYPGSKTPFDTTKDRIGRYYAGPNLSNVIIEGSVNPWNGTIYTPFSYSAKVGTAMPTCNILLEVKPPGSDIWIEQGRQQYSIGRSILIWPNISFRSSPDVLGIGKYRFLSGDAVLEEFQGPEIDVAIRNESADRVKSGRFDYSAEVRSTRPRVEMELWYTDDGVTWINSGLINIYNRTSVSDPEGWLTMVWKNQPWHNTIRINEARRQLT